MNVLSLFDGMSCGMIAMKNANVDIDRYVAYENNKYAIKTATHNFPNIEEMGDVFDGDYTKYNGFDFLIGGSPCTYWSIAQRNENRERIASGLGWELFSQYVRALKESKPNYFIYENNKSMSESIKDSITNTFGFEPICINSALVSAQNRNRLYWVGKRAGDEYVKVNVTQPDDKGILLKDVLDSSLSYVPSDKSYCLTASEWKGQSVEGFLTKHRRQKVFDMVEHANPVCIAQRGRYVSENKAGSPTYQHFEVRIGNKTNALTTVSKDNYIAEQIFKPKRVGTLPRERDGVQTNGQAFRVYSTDAKSVTLKGESGGSDGKTGLYAICNAQEENQNIYTVKGGAIEVNGREYPIKLSDGQYIIRKLSVQECMRLQTVPDWYEFPVSNTQAYKMLGNGWTCDVITHIIKCCLNE